jgi:dCMP deaminase
MTRPTMDETLQLMARTIAKRSTCQRRVRVGSLITDVTRTAILSMGYNGPARGLPNECGGTEPGTCSCVHAEANALIKAPYGQPLVLHTTLSPCVPCARLILNSSVVEVRYALQYRDEKGLDMLTQQGIEVHRTSVVSQIVGYVCEFCYKPASENLPPSWDLVMQSAVCPDCQTKVEDAGGYGVVKGGTYAFAPDPRA